VATYKGIRGPDGSVVVTVDGEPLDPRHDLRNLALAFEWGYVGSGPNQLALALLAHHRDDREALQSYKDFTEAVVSELSQDEWSLDSDDIDRGIENMAPVPMDLKQLLDKVRRG
jgi:hypothetical protein